MFDGLVNGSGGLTETEVEQQAVAVGSLVESGSFWYGGRKLFSPLLCAESFELWTDSCVLVKITGCSDVNLVAVGLCRDWFGVASGDASEDDEVSHGGGKMSQGLDKGLMSQSMIPLKVSSCSTMRGGFSSVWCSLFTTAGSAIRQSTSSTEGSVFFEHLEMLGKSVFLTSEAVRSPLASSSGMRRHFMGTLKHFTPLYLILSTSQLVAVSVSGWVFSGLHVEVEGCGLTGQIGRAHV